MTQKCPEPSTRRIEAGELRRDIYRLSPRDPAQQRRVVVRVTGFGISALKGAHGIEEELPREENEVPIRGFDSCATRLETATIPLLQNSKREPALTRLRKDRHSPICRAVVNDDELGVKSAAVERLDEGCDRRRQMLNLVVDRD